MHTRAGTEFNCRWLVLFQLRASALGTNLFWEETNIYIVSVAGCKIPNSSHLKRKRKRGFDFVRMQFNALP